jgi:hypothetical protein
MNKERQIILALKSAIKLFSIIVLVCLAFLPEALLGNSFNGVIINEIDSDTPGSDTLEFVELYDGGGGNTPLDGLVIVFYNGNGDVSYNAFDLDGFSTDASGHFLLGNSGVIPTPDVIFGNNSLQNGADAVALYIGDGTGFPNGTAVTTNNLVDAIVYDTNDADDPGLLVLLNNGQPQGDENGGGDKDNHSNSRCPNGRGGARNTHRYVQTIPSPALNNVCDPALEATIDIRPDSDTNPINCTSERGVIPIAILSTEVFDATMVDHTTVSFEGACEMHVNKKTGELRRHEEDVDANGYNDLVFHFAVSDSNLDCYSTEGTIMGETFDGQAFQGSDIVHMVGE